MKIFRCRTYSDDLGISPMGKANIAAKTALQLQSKKARQLTGERNVQTGIGLGTMAGAVTGVGATALTKNKYAGAAGFLIPTAIGAVKSIKDYRHNKSAEVQTKKKMLTHALNMKNTLEYLQAKKQRGNV